MPFDRPQRVTRVLIEHALRGDPEAERRLVQVIVSCADRHVRKVLKRNTSCHHRGLVEELVHDVAVYIYDNDAKLLRNWDECRGASFEYYLGLVARNFVIRRLMQVKGNPAAITPVEDMQPFLPNEAAEVQIAYTLGLGQVWRYIEKEVDDRDRSRFEALYVEGISVDALAKREGITTNAVHAWSSRFRKRLRERMPEVIALLQSRHRQ